MPKEVLYIGMDESNHGETKPRIGEIVVATCSYNHIFWDDKRNPDRRAFSRIEESLVRGVDYNYTILPHELAKGNYSNLPLVAPFFVGNFLKSRKDIRQIKLGLDGHLNKEDKEKLIALFAEDNVEAQISNFMKRNKLHYGPTLIYLAHLIANSTLNRSLYEISEDERYIPFDVINL